MSTMQDMWSHARYTSKVHDCCAMLNLDPATLPLEVGYASLVTIGYATWVSPYDCVHIIADALAKYVSRHPNLEN